MKRSSNYGTSLPNSRDNTIMTDVVQSDRIEVNNLQNLQEI